MWGALHRNFALLSALEMSHLVALMERKKGLLRVVCLPACAIDSGHACNWHRRANTNPPLVGLAKWPLRMQVPRLNVPCALWLARVAEGTEPSASGISLLVYGQMFPNLSSLVSPPCAIIVHVCRAASHRCAVRWAVIGCIIYPSLPPSLSPLSTRRKLQYIKM